MNENSPWVITETGTLLTMLLGGETYQSGYAYAGLLADSAKENIFRLAIPDVVLMEFMGSMAPLYAEDFTGPKPNFTSSMVPLGFSMAKERVSLIKELLEADAIRIIPTACGEEYLENIQKMLKHNEEYRTQKWDNGTWPPEIENLRQRLMNPRSPLRKAVKTNSLADEQGNTISSGARDRGELSVADAISVLQREEGSSAPIFVFMEGSDVRGRIIQRLSSDPDTKAYKQHFGEVMKIYNPNEATFDRENAASLGNINFTSTKGVLAAYMKAARDVSPRHGKYSWFIVDPQEKHSKDAMNNAYSQIVANVNEKGLGRQYEMYRDRHITEMKRENEDEYAMEYNIPQNAPWMNYLSQCMEKNHTMRPALQRVIKKYQVEMQKGLEEDSKHRFNEILSNASKMSPEAALGVLRHIQDNLSQFITRTLQRVA